MQDVLKYPRQRIVARSSCGFSDWTGRIQTSPEITGNDPELLQKTSYATRRCADEGDSVMIDIFKVRKWNVRFYSFPEIRTLPFPGIIVEEQESSDYRMPQCCPANIPPETGSQITVTMSGHGILYVGNKQYDCLPGTAFCFRHCDPLVSYRTADNCKWNFLWIGFHGIASERLAAEVNRHYGYFFSLGEKSRLERRLMDYKSYSSSSLRLSPWDGAKIVIEMLEMLCGEANENLKVSSGARLVNEVKEVCRRSYSEPLNGKYLARKIGISRVHLSKTFHQETGIKLRDYLSEQHLNEALSLLLKSNLTCKEIASICHYGSYSAFFRAFRKRYHMSPEVFRKGMNDRENS